jgi:hypothetical protein
MSCLSFFTRPATAEEQLKNYLGARPEETVELATYRWVCFILDKPPREVVAAADGNEFEMLKAAEELYQEKKKKVIYDFIALMKHLLYKPIYSKPMVDRDRLDSIYSAIQEKEESAPLS